MMRVRDPSEEPGSLDAMWPGAPMPRICRSMPPAVRVHVVGHAVGNVHLTRIHVHVVEESRPHVVAIALFVLGEKPHLLIQVERSEL